MEPKEDRIPHDELHQQNTAVAMLVHSLLGAITPNFRMVALNMKEEPWVVRIVLDREDADDRQEIDEVESEFLNQLFSLENPGFSMQVTADHGDIVTPTYPWLVVFRRKEQRVPVA